MSPSDAERPGPRGPVDRDIAATTTPTNEGYSDTRELGARLAFGPRPSRDACVWLDDLGHSWLLDSADPKLELAGGLLVAFVAAVRDLDDLRGRAA